MRQTTHKLTFTLMAFATLFGLASAQEKATPNCDHRRIDSLSITHADVPLYPPLALQARVSGAVDVRIIVKEGAVVRADALESANPLLAAAAKANVQTWHFAPQGYGDFCVRYVYELDENNLISPRNPTVEMDFPDRVKIKTSPVKPPCNDCGPQ